MSADGTLAGVGFAGAGITMGIGVIASLLQLDVGGVPMTLDGGAGAMVALVAFAVGVAAAGIGLYRISRDGVRVRLDATPATRKALESVGARIDRGRDDDGDADS